MLQTGSLKSVDVTEIELDCDNPRIRKYLEMYPNPTPEQMYLALGAGSDDPESGSTTTFEKLKQSIQTNGGVIQPVIVNRKQDGRLICIEGNTRVAIYKDFLEQNIPGNWHTIQAFVHEDLGETDIEAVRLQAHLVPPRPWDPYSKARYLNYLRNHEHLPWGTLVDYAGGREKEIVESINAYKDMEKFYRAVVPDDGSFDTKKFSAFVELQKPGIKDAIFGSKHTLTEFAEWVFKGNIFPLNTVRLLPAILKNDEAHKVFLTDVDEGGGARKASNFLDRPDLSKTLSEADVLQLSRALNLRVLQMNFQEMRQLKSDPSGMVSQELTQAYETLRGLLEALDLLPI